MSEPERRPLLWRAFVVGIVLALGVGYAIRPTAERGAPPVAPAPAASQDPSAPSPLAIPGDASHAPPSGSAPSVPVATEAAKAANPSLEKPLAPFATLSLSRADFPTSGSVTVKVDLGAPSADDKPRTVRMFSQTDQRGILTDARLDETRTIGTIQLDPNFLQPGEYFVEVTTTERSAFPVRRYAIVVR